MAGYKHGRSGDSEGAEKVSPLASQLQQVWMQTQMPKAQKRSLTSVPGVKSSQHHQPLQHLPKFNMQGGGVEHNSALKSLSSIFPEIVDMPEETTKPMIYSVFEEGEELEPIPEEVRERRIKSLTLLFQNVIICDNPSPWSSKQVTTRSISEPLMGASSIGFPAAAGGNSKPLTVSHSFSGFEPAFSKEPLEFGAPETATEYANLRLQASSTELAEEVVPEEKNYLFSYLSDILMEEKVGESKCMFMEISAHQAMAKELGDLISHDVPSPPLSGDSISTISFEDSIPKDFVNLTEPPSLYNSLPRGDISPISPFDEDGERVDEWIEKLLSGPLPAELADSPPTNTTGGISSEMFSNGLGSPSIITTTTTTGGISPQIFTNDLGNPPPTTTGGISPQIFTNDLGNPPPATTGGISPQIFTNDLGNPPPTTTGGISSEMFSDDLGGLGFRVNSGFGSGISSRGWENRTVDNECEVVDSPDLLFSGSGFAAPGASLYPVTRKPVIPPANGNGVHIPPVDLKNLLIRCAEAVERSDFQQANELIDELRQHSSAYGNGPQRMAHYFMEALVARMSGTGAQLYTALSNKHPSECQMLKGFRLFFDHIPFIHSSHTFANDTFLEAFKGASRVHVVDYGILYGLQWPCLISRLSQRPGGPPHLRITGIDRPQPGFRPSAKIQETGRRLAKLAMLKGVPFEFHAIAEKWEAITPAHLMLREDEVLGVNCVFRLRHTLDETVTAASPRTTLLSRIRSMNPKVFVQGVLNAEYNAPFFMSRFRSALAHYSALFDALENSLPPDHADRHILDQEIFGREILNIVACEGLERVERAEPYRQWQSRTLRAGFQQVRQNPEIISKIKKSMKMYHRNYGVGEDGAWFLMGWKGHISKAITVWEPAPVASP